MAIKKTVFCIKKYLRSSYKNGISGSKVDFIHYFAYPKIRIGFDPSWEQSSFSQEHNRTRILKKTLMKNLLLVFGLMFGSSICFSQDIISVRDGDDILATITKVGPTEVEYKKFDNPDGPLYSILKSDILLIKYENGTHEVFDDLTPAKPAAGQGLFIKGQTDATAFYDGYKGAGTGTLLLSLVSPLAGLIPAIACSSTNPKDNNLNYPDPELMKQPDYSFSYRQQAKKIKSRKVWTNWGIALGVNFIAVLFITADQ
jgi:hypothetical protein